MSHLGTGSCAAPGSQGLSLNVWTDTSGEQKYLVATALPSRKSLKQVRRQPRTTIWGARRPGFQTWFSCSPGKVFRLALPFRNPKGTSHLNYPQLNSSLCPQRCVTLSGNSTNTPSHPDINQAVIRGVLSPSLPHTSDPSPWPRASTSQLLPGQSSPSSNATITFSL